MKNHWLKMHEAGLVIKEIRNQWEKALEPFDFGAFDFGEKPSREGLQKLYSEEVVLVEGGETKVKLEEFADVENIVITVNEATNVMVIDCYAVGV
jgi:hypothetical protein